MAEYKAIQCFVPESCRTCDMHAWGVMTQSKYVFTEGYRGTPVKSECAHPGCKANVHRRAICEIIRELRHPSVCAYKLTGRAIYDQTTSCNLVEVEPCDMVQVYESQIFGWNVRRMNQAGMCKNCKIDLNQYQFAGFRGRQFAYLTNPILKQIGPEQFTSICFDLIFPKQSEYDFINRAIMDAIPFMIKQLDPTPTEAVGRVVPKQMPIPTPLPLPLKIKTKKKFYRPDDKIALGNFIVPNRKQSKVQA
jgi:hypothetical protein